jgi:peptide/nickel transport system permease protein
LKNKKILLFLKKMPIAGGIVFGLVILSAIFGPMLVPYGPGDQDFSRVLKPPFWQNGGEIKHPLGTDMMGRDIVSRLIHGARVSLFVGLVTVLFSCFIGTWLGMASGYMGGKIDSLIMRLTDIQLSMPYILIAIAIIGALGPSIKNIILVIAVTNWVGYARIIRGEVLTIRQMEFVEAAVVGGCSTLRILSLHILPNVANSITVLATLDLGRVIIFESAFSFLGLGVQPPTTSWGSMLADGRIYLTYAWWLATFPGLAIMFTVLGTNLLGDWLRDTLDPKRKRYVIL